jgi:transcription-repair coupling factor (superfamily II helicase)
MSNTASGRFKGLETITALGAPHACVALEYAGGDGFICRSKISNFSAATAMRRGLLDKLGGGRLAGQEGAAENASAKSPTA